MMKKQFRKSILAVSVLGLVAGMSGNVLGNSNEATGTTKARVVESLTIESGVELAFGRFARTADGGNVGVNRSSCELQDTTVPHFGQQACGTFNVYGAADEEFSISYPKSGLQISTGNGGPNETMAYSLILDDDGDDAKTLNSNGEASLQFGGSLTVKPDQEPGLYTGNYVVSVDYLNVYDN